MFKKICLFMTIMFYIATVTLSNSTICSDKHFSYNWSIAKLSFKTTIYSCSVSKIRREIDCSNNTIPGNEDEILEIETTRETCLKIFKTRELFDEMGIPWFLDKAQLNKTSQIKYIGKCNDGRRVEKKLITTFEQLETDVNIFNNSIVIPPNGYHCQYSDGACRNTLGQVYWNFEEMVFKTLPYNISRECRLNNITNYLYIKNIRNADIQRLNLREVKSFQINYWLTEENNIVIISSNTTANADNEKIAAEIAEQAIRNLQQQVFIITYLCLFSLVIIFVFLTITVYNYYLTSKVVSLKNRCTIFLFQGYLNKILYNKIKDIDFKIHVSSPNEYTYIEEDVVFK